MAEVAKDVTTTEEVLVVSVVAEEALADLEAEAIVMKEVLVVADLEAVVTEVLHQEAEDLAQEKKVDHLIDQQEKVVLEVMLQEENQVHLKEKAAHQDVLKEVLIDQQVVHSMMQKLEDLEEAKKIE